MEVKLPKIVVSDGEREKYVLYRSLRNLLLNLNLTIFGGAVRDELLGKMPNDLDVLIDDIDKSGKISFKFKDELALYAEDLDFEAHDLRNYVWSDTDANERIIADFHERMHYIPGYLELIVKRQICRNSVNSTSYKKNHDDYKKYRRNFLGSCEEHRKYRAAKRALYDEIDNKYRAAKRVLYDEIDNKCSGLSMFEYEKVENDLFRQGMFKLMETYPILAKIDYYTNKSTNMENNIKLDEAIDLLSKHGIEHIAKRIKIWDKSNPEIAFSIDFVCRSTLSKIFEHLALDINIDYDVNSLYYSFQLPAEHDIYDGSNWEEEFDGQLVVKTLIKHPKHIEDKDEILKWQKQRVAEIIEHLHNNQAEAISYIHPIRKEKMLNKGWQLV